MSQDLSGKAVVQKWFTTKTIEEFKVESLIADRALRYNEGKPQFSLIDFDSLIPLVQVLEFGAKKYSRDNWKKEMPKNELMDSLMRHMVALLRGEENDPESGLPHIGHIMANAMFISYHSKQ